MHKNMLNIQNKVEDQIYNPEMHIKFIVITSIIF